MEMYHGTNAPMRPTKLSRAAWDALPGVLKRTTAKGAAVLFRGRWAPVRVIDHDKYGRRRK